MRFAHGAITVLLLFTIASCQEKPVVTDQLETTVPSSTEQQWQSFNTRIETTIHYMPLLPEEKKALRGKLAHTPLTERENYDINLFSSDGELVGSVSAYGGRVTRDNVDLLYSGSYNALAYSMVHPKSGEKSDALNDSQLKAWYENESRNWFQCRDDVLEKFGDVIADSNLDPMLNQLCTEYLTRRALTRIWFTQSWDDPLPTQHECAMHCAFDTGAVRLASGRPTAEDDSNELYCRLDCPQTAATASKRR